MACFAVYMQHTLEQQGRPTDSSREPTHWMKTTVFGSSGSSFFLPMVEGRWTWPPVGPEAFNIRSYCRPEITSGIRPEPYLSLIHISEPTRRTPISYAVFC